MKMGRYLNQQRSILESTKGDGKLPDPSVEQSNNELVNRGTECWSKIGRVSWSQEARDAGEESDEPISRPELPGAGEDAEPSASTCRGTELAAAAVGTMKALSISSGECPSVKEKVADIEDDEKCAKSI